MENIKDEIALIAQERSDANELSILDICYRVQDLLADLSEIRDAHREEQARLTEIRSTPPSSQEKEAKEEEKQGLEIKDIRDLRNQML